jgi:hypothetical protein
MVPLYAARIADLGPGDFVKIECIACGHGELIPECAVARVTAAALYARARFGTAAPVSGV